MGYIDYDPDAAAVDRQEECAEECASHQMEQDQSAHVPF